MIVTNKKVTKIELPEIQPAPLNPFWFHSMIALIAEAAMSILSI